MQIQTRSPARRVGGIETEEGIVPPFLSSFGAPRRRLPSLRWVAQSWGAWER